MARVFVERNRDNGRHHFVWTVDDNGRVAAYHVSDSTDLDHGSSIKTVKDLEDNIHLKEIR